MKLLSISWQILGLKAQPFQRGESLLLQNNRKWYSSYLDHYLIGNKTSCRPTQSVILGTVHFFMREGVLVGFGKHYFKNHMTPPQLANSVFTWPPL